MSDVANEIEAVCAAAAERAELAAEHDEQLEGVVGKLRRRLRSPDLTRERLEGTAALAEELGELVPARLELAAHEARLIGHIVEAIAVGGAGSSGVLRCQATHAHALASALRVTAEILDVRAEVECRAASEPTRP